MLNCKFPGVTGCGRASLRKRKRRLPAAMHDGGISGINQAERAAAHRSRLGRLLIQIKARRIGLDMFK
jgi:hypothetical protein